MEEERKFASGKNADDSTFKFTRFRDLGALEDAVSENGEKADSIQKLLDRTRESQEGIKRAILDDKLDRVREAAESNTARTKEIAELKVYMAGEFGKLQGAREAEQRATSTSQWTWQLVVSNGIALLALVAASIAAYAAFRH